MKKRNLLTRMTAGILCSVLSLSFCAAERQTADTPAVLTASAATFDDINADGVFLQQPSGSVTCTLYSVMNMLRRAYILDGKSGWQNITEANVRSQFWGADGMANDVTYGGYRVQYFGANWDSSPFPTDSAGKKKKIIDMLNQHPEGFVAYDCYAKGGSANHAILLTDYDASTDTIYCVDPSRAVPGVRMPLQNSTRPDFNYFDGCWIITNKAVSGVEEMGPWTTVNKTYIVSTTDSPLNMRSGPATSYSIVTEMPKGAEVTVLETRGRWAKVKYGDKTGYASLDYLTVKPDTTPAKPKLSVKAGTNYATSTVTWAACENADHYAVRFYSKSGSEYTEVRKNESYRDLSYTISLLEGTYAVSVDAVSKDGKTASSGKVDFSVGSSTIKPIASESFNGHVYAVYDAEVWYENAAALCQKWSGHLATITSQEENDFVQSLLKTGKFARYWIGGKETATEGTYEWTTGEKMTYTNWQENQPDNSNKNENRMEIHKANGLWNDLPMAYNSVGFVMEIEPQTAKISGQNKKNAYAVFEGGFTWSEAKTYCKMLGGHLVYINNEEENNFLKWMVKNSSVPAFFTGAKKNADGSFLWLDGSDLSYSSWGETQPDNNQGIEEFVELRPDGTWNDVKNDQAKRGFICEFEDANDYTELGDVNKDDIITIADAVMLQKYLTVQGDLSAVHSGDVNLDGTINAVDLTLLKRQLLTAGKTK